MHSNIRNRLFSLLLTFAMLFALFPTSVLATEDGADESPQHATTAAEAVDMGTEEDTAGDPVQKTVSTVEELKDALTGTDTSVVITVTNDIELTSCVQISGERSIVLQGTTDAVKITFNQAVDEMNTQETRSMFYFLHGANVSMTVQNIVLDGGRTARLFRLGDTKDGSSNSLTLNDGGVLQNGYPQLPSSVTGNQPAGGAIQLGNNSRFIMNGGKIINNKANRYGGGIYGWVSDAIVEINGGEISGNEGKYAGGIVMLGNSTLYLHGGTITDNTSTGIHSDSIFFQDGTMYIGGAVEIAQTSRQKRGIYYNNKDAKTYIDSPLTGEVFFQNNRLHDILPFSNYILTAEDAAHLRVNANEKTYYLDAANNQIKLSNAKTITFYSNFGDSDSYTQKVPVNIATALTANAFARENYIFAGWSTQQMGGETTYADKAEITATDNITLYAQWIKLESNDISMEYGSAPRQLPTINGVTLTWNSNDENVVTVSDNQIHAVGVGSTTLTAEASTAAGGTATLTVNVEVTPMPITFGSAPGENPNGRITYARASIAPEFSQFAKFYPAQVESGNVSVVEGSRPITLTQGTDITFEYDAGGGEAAYNYLPLYVTDGEGVRVTVRLINDNYRFVTRSDSNPSYTITETVVVTAAGKTETEITGLPNVNPNSSYEYTGVGIAPITDLTGIRAEGIGSFTVHFHRWGDTVFPPQHLENKPASELTQTAIQGIAPKEPGSYLMILDGVSDSKYGHQSWIFTIVKGTPEGEPTFEKASSGVVLSTVTLSGSMKNAAGTEVAGKFSWNDGNVTVTRGTAYSWTFTPTDPNYNTVPGTAVVWPAPSGGGSGSSNVSGSGDNVTITASGGSVTASQMESAVKKADEGAAITIKSTSSTTVTLPVGGMEKAADNDNDVRLDLRYGEITLSARAIAGMTDGISSNDKIKISITSQTSSKDKTISDLLDKGAAVFDVSVTVNDVEVHSFDGALTITLTVSNLSKITDPHILHILTSGTKEYYAPDSISGNTITVKGIRNLSTFAVIPGSEVPQNNPFADVSTSDYYYDAVLWAVENGVTNGTSATTFSPDMAVSRAQMVTFLWRAHGSPKATGTNPFTDVSTSDYYYDAVLWAVANGVTNGTSATTFSPDAPVTRAQAVTFQWRAAGSLVVSGSSFGDVAADAYYVNAVTWAVANGITNGTGGNSFSPDVVVSRAQAVTFLYRELG